MKINKPEILQLSKSLGVTQNVTLRVLDATTGELVQEHVGHNTATNSMLLGIGHYLTGDGVFEQGYHMLSQYVPQYISLGTMGLISQHADAVTGLPTGIGVAVPEGSGEAYDRLIAAEEALDAAKKNLANFCPHFLETGKCYTGQACSTCTTRLNNLRTAVTNAENEYNAAYEAVAGSPGTEAERFKDYLNQRPGYGADGYDINQNNSRKWFGLGKVFKDRPVPERTINCELISASFPRTLISFRDIVPEVEAELPKTIDVVFSAMISTGALKQFREPGKDYIFITEAGLWSKPDWPKEYIQTGPGTYNWNDESRDYECGENGLLAAYRLAPPNEDDWDMDKAANRDKLKRSILKVGMNQVVQVIWKIQLGSIDQFGGIGVLKG